MTEKPTKEVKRLIDYYATKRLSSIWYAMLTPMMRCEIARIPRREELLEYLLSADIDILKTGNTPSFRNAIGTGNWISIIAAEVWWEILRNEGFAMSHFYQIIWRGSLRWKRTWNFRKSFLEPNKNKLGLEHIAWEINDIDFSINEIDFPQQQNYTQIKKVTCEYHSREVLRKKRWHLLWEWDADGKERAERHSALKSRKVGKRLYWTGFCRKNRKPF